MMALRLMTVKCPRCLQTWKVGEPFNDGPNAYPMMKLAKEVSLSFHYFYGTPFTCGERDPEFVEYLRTG